jgi:hypothetical protein
MTKYNECPIMLPVLQKHQNKFVTLAPQRPRLLGILSKSKLSPPTVQII